MNLRLSAIAAFVACAGAIGLAAPASAAPLALEVPAGAKAAVSADIVEIGHRRGYYRHRGHFYYNGHRGYRHHRRGYRRHRGHYFPHAAFVFQFHVRPHVRHHRHYRHYHGVVPHRAHPRARVIRLDRRHYHWCDKRYRSYRRSDNSFQPYHGPRKQCVSPY